MTTSALLRHGPAHAAVLLDGLSAWMERKGFASVDDVRGILSVAPGCRRGRARAHGLRRRAAEREQQRLRSLVTA